MNNSSYFIMTWRNPVSKAAEKRITKMLKMIDSSVTFVNAVNIPGNTVHAWLERPNDGSNNDNWRRETNARCIAAVNAEVK